MKSPNEMKEFLESTGLFSKNQVQIILGTCERPQEIGHVLCSGVALNLIDPDKATQLFEKYHYYGNGAILRLV